MKQVSSNIVYNIAYQFLLYIVPLITTPFLSRVIGAEGIGIYSYNYSISYYFIVFAMLGLNNYGSRRIAETKKEEMSKTFWSIYAIQFVTSCIVIIGYLLYCLFISDSKMYSVLFSLSVVSSLFDINWFFFGIEKFKITVSKNAIVKIASLILILLFVRDSDDVIVYILIMVSGILISQLVLWPFLLKEVKPCRVHLSDVLPHIKPNFLLFVPVIASGVYKMMDKIMIGVIVDYTEVGYYENCEKVLNIPTNVIVAIGTVMMPRVTKTIAEKNEKLQEKYFDYMIIFSAAFSSLLCFGVMGVTKEFICWFFGTEFVNCNSIMLVIFPSSLFLALANVLRTQILIPYKMDTVYVMSVVFGAILNFSLNMFLIEKCGAVGAAFATVLAEGAVFFIQFAYITAKRGFNRIFVYILPFYGMGLLMFTVLYGMGDIGMGNFASLLVKAAIGGTAFLVLAYMYIKCVLKKKVAGKR